MEKPVSPDEIRKSRIWTRRKLLQFQVILRRELCPRSTVAAASSTVTATNLAHTLPASSTIAAHHLFSPAPVAGHSNNNSICAVLVCGAKKRASSFLLLLFQLGSPFFLSPLPSTFSTPIVVDDCTPTFHSSPVEFFLSFNNEVEFVPSSTTTSAAHVCRWQFGEFICCVARWDSTAYICVGKTRMEYSWLFFIHSLFQIATKIFTFRISSHICINIITLTGIYLYSTPRTDKKI